MLILIFGFFRPALENINMLVATFNDIIVLPANDSALYISSTEIPLIQESPYTPVVSDPHDPVYSPQFFPNTIEITTQFYIPPLDLRGYHLDHFEAEAWFLQRINYHRNAYGIHPYILYIPAVVTSIEHSLDMRDNDFSGNAASDGRAHQVRHHRWMGYRRTKITSTSNSTHDVEGPLTQQKANEFIDDIFSRDNFHDFLMNPTYYYIGIGFSVQENGRGRLSITMASVSGERAAHHARTPDEREQHRLEYLERVRAERGWVPPPVSE